MSRRKQTKLCHLFKIVHGLTDCQCAPVIRKRPLYNTRQVSNLSLQDISVNTSQFLYSFYPHFISSWNSLPPNHQMLTTLYSFKGTVSPYKRIFSNGSRMGIPIIQSSTWAMWFCDVAIMPLACAWPAELALRPRLGVYFGVR